MPFEMIQRQNQKFSQKMNMTQSMRLNQKQIQSLKMLSLSSFDLRNEIYEFAQKNPALEVEEEKIDFDRKNEQKFDGFSDYENYSVVNHDSEMASDNFQKTLESNEDTRESLTSHLFNQLKLQKLSKDEFYFCEKLIENLDSKGFHKFSPISLFDKKKIVLKNETSIEDFVEKCEKIIQRLDPIGLCCKDVFESLFIQATIISQEKYVPKLALFILNEHFDFLNPPLISKATKKINNFLESQKILRFANSDQKTETFDFVDEEDVQEALDFIKTLNPNPARDFGVDFTNFVVPDVFVERSDFEEFPFKITVQNENLPILKISKSYENFHNFISKIPEDKKNERQKAELKFSKDAIQSAKDLIENLQFRENIIKEATFEIVKNQIEFFLKGSRFLHPFSQKQLAEILNVSPSTISRMANEKFLSCEWGVFPFSYFFTNAVNEETSANSLIMDFSKSEFIPSSKEGVKTEILKIIEEHKNDKKQLSDQKISDLLSEMGIKVARRTVGKYRSELNLNSSYLR